MVTIDSLKNFALQYDVPTEDVLFTAINFYGVHMDVSFNRMRTAFHLNGNDEHFSMARDRDDLNYYLALPINHTSPFSIRQGKMFLDGYYIGDSIGATEDFCDSHYPRRLGTALNINPNSRTSCRGCKFCYTAYQVPLDKKKLRTKDELVQFFDEWLQNVGMPDLSHLIQVSIVTGCYDSEEQLVEFILLLSNVLKDYNFGGRIFYLGSMLCSKEQLQRLREVPSFGYCISLECFEHRDLLIGSKRALSLSKLKDIMKISMEMGFEVNYTYVLGLEPLDIAIKHMRDFLDYTNKFPTINILQIHQEHSKDLLDKSITDIGFFLEARKQIEAIYKNTSRRPLVWEDYRSLWYLKFADENLMGIRFPNYFWEDKVIE